MEDDYFNDWNNFNPDPDNEFIGYINENNLSNYDDDEDNIFLNNNEEEDQLSEQYDSDIDEFDIGPSYADTQRTGVGGTRLGGNLGLNRLEQAVQQQEISKEELFIVKFKLNLKEKFNNTENIDRIINDFSKQVMKIPKYWLRNIDALTTVLKMYDYINLNKLTLKPDILNVYSKQYNINKSDLFRYYRLIKKFIKI